MATRSLKVLKTLADKAFEPEHKSKSRMVFNMELAEWCAKGNGQVWFEDKISTIYTYNMGLDNGVVPYFIRVRKWGDNDWHEAISDYMGIE